MLNVIQRIEDIASRQQQRKEVHHDTHGNNAGENAWIVRALTSEREVAFLKEQLGIAKTEKYNVDERWEKKQEEWEKKQGDWEKKQGDWEKKQEEWVKKKEELNNTLLDLMRETLELKAELRCIQPKSLG
ncbi:hypothetical protein BGZ76_005618 [Entomortierella beljakovae]|nr:hypothetical protein BGZ76_005618 [Entomortierella beljakovae]